MTDPATPEPRTAAQKASDYNRGLDLPEVQTNAARLLLQDWPDPNYSGWRREAIRALLDIEAEARSVPQSDPPALLEAYRAYWNDPAGAGSVQPRSVQRLVEAVHETLREDFAIVPQSERQHLFDEDQCWCNPEATD